MADVPPVAGERTGTIYWCSRCKCQSGRLHHFCEKGPALIPQLDEYTLCDAVEVVELSRLRAAEEKTSYWQREHHRQQQFRLVALAERDRLAEVLRQIDAVDTVVLGHSVALGHLKSAVREVLASLGLMSDDPHMLDREGLEAASEAYHSLLDQPGQQTVETMVSVVVKAYLSASRSPRDLEAAVEAARDWLSRYAIWSVQHASASFEERKAAQLEHTRKALEAALPHLEPEGK